MNKHLNIKVFGQVQRVTFRNSAQEKADELNINGFAQNLDDGSVYIEAEGTDEELKKFLEWCKVGPKIAKVKNIEYQEGSLNNFNEFLIK